nr:helicase-related protein [Thermococcus sp. JdF3]
MISRPVRILIADEIGLGKTVQALAIARYLQLRGEAKRILVLVPKILREQWKQEIRRVGGFPTVIENGREVESKLRNTYGYTVVSIDLAKRSPHRERFLDIKWDLIIVDEVHNVTLGTQRYEFLKDLVEEGGQDLNLIFLSATPHRGNPKDYLARIALLDPTLTDQYQKLDKPGFYSKTRDTLVMRRTKKVVNELEGREVFKKCYFGAVVVEISDAERAFFDKLDKTLFEMIKDARENSPEALLAVLVRKRASSSYEAAVKTISKIAESANSEGSGKAEKVSKYIKSLFGLGYDEIELEDFNELDDAVEKIIAEYSPLLDRKQVESFRGLLELATQIKERDSKLQMVAEIAAYHIKQGGKVIIFTEFKDTLEYIKRKLPKILADEYGVRLEGREISLLYGGMSSREVEEQMARFERHGKLLISTDVASEGLNLQIASVVINYEAPWSPIKLEQRVGRIWRLSQPRETTAYTLFLAAETDLYILENLYQKIMNITEAIGSGPRLGKPVFGKQMFSGDFEALWKEEVSEESAKGEQPSEYDLVIAAIKRELTGYAGAIIHTLKSLRRNIEKMIPSDTAKQVREELEHILTPRDFDRDTVSEVLRTYLTEVLGKRNIPEISPILHDVVKEGPSNLRPMKIGVRGGDGVEYLYFVRLVDEKDGREFHRYPVLVRRNGGKLEFLYGVDVLKRLIEVFSQEFVVIGRPEPTMEEHVISSQLRTLARDRFYRPKTKYRNYERAFSRGKLKKGRLFKNTKIETTEVLRIEGISEERFNILKHVPSGILDVYGLSEKDVEPPTDEYKRITERNFVPLEDILKSERKAMEIVMELERKRLEQEYGPGGGWEVKDVSLKAHYDIRVVEPEGEKYIEVKGHKPLLLTAEVTPAEYKFATDSENVDKYWIYIVANLGKKKPAILKVFRPFERDAKVYAVLEDGKEVEITGKVSINIENKIRKILLVG